MSSASSKTDRQTDSSSQPASQPGRQAGKKETNKKTKKENRDKQRERERHPRDKRRQSLWHQKPTKAEQHGLTSHATVTDSVVHRALRLPRFPRFTKCCACHEICTSRFTSCSPASAFRNRKRYAQDGKTKLATHFFQESDQATLSKVPCTCHEIRAHQRPSHSPKGCVGTKSAHRSRNGFDLLHLPRKVNLSATKGMRIPLCLPATKSDHQVQKCARHARHRNESPVKERLQRSREA